jgi:hypothetical protein
MELGGTVAVVERTNERRLELLARERFPAVWSSGIATGRCMGWALLPN